MKNSETRYSEWAIPLEFNNPGVTPSALTRPAPLPSKPIDWEEDLFAIDLNYDNNKG